MSAFAQAVGTTTATISRVADGIVIPRRELMQRIHSVTGGCVTPNDLVGLYCVRPCAGIADNDAVEPASNQEGNKEHG